MIKTDVDLLRQSMIDYLMSFVGRWYKWGGDDPSGFDCSGLANEGLKSVGLIERGNEVDFTADGLISKFRQYAVTPPYMGCLAFWINSTGRAYHVEICINHLQTIGASGGGSSTTTVEAAIQQNAFIKVRPIKVGAICVDPFKKILDIG